MRECTFIKKHVYDVTQNATVQFNLNYNIASVKHQAIKKHDCIVYTVTIAYFKGKLRGCMYVKLIESHEQVGNI